MKKNKRRNKIILLVVLLLGLTVGFAALSTTLRINGIAGIKKNTWSVYWSNAQVMTGSVSSTAPTIGQDSGDPVNTKASWSVTFTEPGQFYGFTIDATNAGTLDALLSEIQVTTNPATLPDYIKLTFTNADGSKIVPNTILPKANGNTPSTKKFKMVVTYDPSVDDLEDMEDEVTIGVVIGDPFVPVPPVTPDDPNQGRTKVTLKSGDENLKGKTDAQLVEYYGTDITGFNTIYPIEWQLFYSDEDNVYLITKDYVRNSYLPDELYKYPGDSDNTPMYGADFCTFTRSYMNYYDCTGPIITNEDGVNNPWPNAGAASSLANNPLTSKYLRWVSLYPNSTNYNMKATAYMMDTSVWANFSGNTIGAYAMGGPTLEMFMLSYNAKHSDKFVIDNTLTPAPNDSNTDLQYNVNSKGYKARLESWDNSYWYGIYASLDSTDSMWVKASQDKALLYWIASPSGADPSYMPYVFYNGTFSSNYYLGQAEEYSNVITGFRPLVAIPKSSLE
jgi:hypothetical protein